MPPPRLDVLHGWKEIANYMRKGVRSVQRYERKLGLPIHRIGRKSGSAVLATKAELDAWISTTPVGTNESPRRVPPGLTSRLGADFLRIDSETALTFSAIALDTRDSEKRIRATRTARKAYNSIMRLSKNIEFTEAERQKLDANLQRLKDELQRLGERL